MPADGDTVQLGFDVIIGSPPSAPPGADGDPFAARARELVRRPGAGVWPLWSRQPTEVWRANVDSHLDPAAFLVCERDLSHIVGRMMATRAAEDLTTVARRLIQDRLELGPARGAAIVHPVSDRDRVRLPGSGCLACWGSCSVLASGPFVMARGRLLLRR